MLKQLEGGYEVKVRRSHGPVASFGLFFSREVAESVVKEIAMRSGPTPPFGEHVVEAKIYARVSKVVGEDETGKSQKEEGLHAGEWVQGKAEEKKQKGKSDTVASIIGTLEAGWIGVERAVYRLKQTGVSEEAIIYFLLDWIQARSEEG